MALHCRAAAVLLLLLLLHSGCTRVVASVPSVAVDRAPVNLTEPFDFWLLALSWPPSVLPRSQHSWAQHAIARHEAAPGMWTHGLWPVRYAHGSQGADSPV
jgi:ribonuclease I